MPKKQNPAALRFFSVLAWGQEGLIAVLILWAVIVGSNFFTAGRPSLFDPAFVLKNLPPLGRMNGDVLFVHLSHLSKLLLLVAVIAGIGRAALTRLFKTGKLNCFESLSLSYALGLGIVGYAVFSLAALRWLTSPGIIALSVCLCLAAVLLNRDIPASRTSFAGDLSGLFQSSGWDIAFAMVVGTLLFTYGFYSLTPEVFHDSLVYHLAFPSLYTLEARFVSAVSNMYSGMPMQFQMVYVLALFADNEILAKLLHWSAGVSVVIGMLGLSLRMQKPTAGWIASAIFLSTPVIALNQIKSGVDVATCCWIFASVQSLTLHFAQGEDDRSKSFWILSAVLAGFGMASKYTAWPYLIVLAACFFALKVRKADIVVYVLCALAVLSPWLLKNLWFYGNPIFPYWHAQSHPNAYPVDWRALFVDGWGRDWSVIIRSGRSVFEAAANPWFSTIQGKTEFDYIGPIYLLGLPSLFWLRAVSQEARIWRLILVGLWIFWWTTTSMPRFFMPGFALLSVWIALSVFEIKTAAARHAVVAGLLLLVWNNFTAAAFTMHKFQNFSYLIQGEPRAEFLNRNHPTYYAPYYSAAEWINRNSPSDARVLIIGDGRGYYLERPFVGYSILDANLFSFWLSRSSSPEELKAKLDQEKITYLLVNMATLMRSKQPIAFDPQHLKVLSEFLSQYTVLRFNDQDLSKNRWCMVYEIAPSRGIPRPTPDFLYYWYTNQLGLRRVDPSTIPAKTEK